MRTAISFIKENGRGWVERRFRECERIREEEKKDRMAVIKQTKKRYGVGKLSKDENSKLKMRTEERILLSKAKENLWKRYRGRAGHEEGEEDAWDQIRRGLEELDEEEGGETHPWLKTTKLKSSALKNITELTA